MLELAVDLVTEEPRVALGAELDDAVEHVRRHLGAGGVVRRVDVDELGVGPERLLERVEVVRPAVGGGAAPRGHVGACRPRDLQRRLVTRRFDDDVVARLEQRVTREEDPLLGGRDDDHVVGLGRLVDRRARRAQLRCSGRLRVTEAKGVQPLGRVGLEGEQVGDGNRLGVARREHVGRRELVNRVVPLDAERGDLHRATT